MESIFIGKVALLNKKDVQPDVNGNYPVILDVIAGSCPNKRTLSGTFAANAGLIPGNCYLVQATELDRSEEYGRQFRFTSLGVLVGIDLIKAKNELGAPRIVMVDEIVEESTEDKSIVEESTEDKSIMDKVSQ